MKLSNAVQGSLIESRFFVFCEEGEAPRWSFNYDTYKNDPAPDILVLGAYVHPNTGNNLVGGVNLNYLDKAQRDDLARVLPKLMQQSNLYQRYHLGRKLLPGVFDNYYRTYNAANIRGVNQSVFHPKYGMMQATKDFLKKKIGGLFKSKAQRAKDAEPKFPNDLSGMKDALDQAVTTLGLQVAQGKEEPDTPEMQAARNNFMKFKADRAKSMAQIDREEDVPFVQANLNFQQTQLQNAKATPQQVGTLAANAVRNQQSIPTPPPREMTPQQMGASIAQERAANQQELTNPANSLDLDMDGVPDDQEQALSPQIDQETQGYLDELDRLNESIVYFCPKLKRYIMEDLGESIKEHILFESGITNRKPITWGDCTPDTIFMSDNQAIAFVYTSDHQLYTSGDGDTHSDLIQWSSGANRKRLAARYNGISGNNLRNRIGQIDLLGRVGKVAPLNIKVVSFWNNDQKLYDDMLQDCLNALLRDGIIDHTYLISTPITGVVTQNEIFDKKVPTQQISDKDIELYKELHLMRGVEKQSAMKKLGVGNGGKPHPMATAMSNAGLLKPGQKWWALTSEGILCEPDDKTIGP